MFYKKEGLVELFLEFGSHAGPNIYICISWSGILRHCRNRCCRPTAHYTFMNMKKDLLQTTWPPLPLNAWRETYATLHMWSQIVGKVALALMPPMNHFWYVALQIRSGGLSTLLLPHGNRMFTMTFDFVTHDLVVQSSDGAMEKIPLEPRSVKAFYEIVMDTLRRMGLETRIWPMPVEIPNPIRLDTDVTHHSYDPVTANTFWHILVTIKPVFEDFRTRFIGKSSPVHFFWGSFDLASTRFSGRRAPERPGADPITKEAYSHELISHGFWPGSGPIQEPAFYAYAAPEPAGFQDAAVQPRAAFYSKDLSEFILPYEAVRNSSSPESDLTAFLETTYNAGADLGKWDRANLERK